MAYFKISEPATLQVVDPNCNACEISVCADDGRWVCPQCGTTWPLDASNDDTGELPDDWDTIPGPLVPVQAAWLMPARPSLEDVERELDYSRRRNRLAAD